MYVLFISFIRYRWSDCNCSEPLRTGLLCPLDSETTPGISSLDPLVYLKPGQIEIHLDDSVSDSDFVPDLGVILGNS